MNSFRTVIRFAFIPLFALAVSSVPLPAQEPGGDEEEELGEFFDSVPVPEGLTKEEIQSTLALTLAGREWTVKQKTDRRVVGYLKHRGNEATVTLLFGGEKVDIYCVGWQIDKNGRRIKPDQPKGWLNFLRKDIGKRFAMDAATG